MSTSSARNPGIDLLRGLAILLVILNHIGLRIRLTKTVLAAALPDQFLNDLTFNGSEGVFIFFVISGFLIASNSIQRWGSLGTINARAFYARRTARIVPCLVALVAILSVLHLAHVQDYVIHRPHQSLHGAVASAFGLYLNWYEAQTGYLPANWDVLWSLSIEEVFYLGFPLVCVILRKDWLLAPALTGLALSQPFALTAIVHNPIWHEKAYLPGMAGIATGVLTAIIAARLDSHLAPNRRWLRTTLQLVGAAGVFVILGFEDDLAHFIGQGVFLVLTLSTAALVLGFHLQVRAVPAWSFKGTGWLQSFGRLSYEIYLTHMFVVLLVVRAFHSTQASLRWGFLWYLPAIALAWMLGWLVAKYFSFPTERALRQLLLKPKKITSAKEAVELQPLR
ncbi:MAG TPA: acyltransferase [Terracidiphilus sp.]|nr:acyltransferase [Terracidiphilus sp.]